MSKSKIIDTFPAFLAFWDTFRSEPLDAQIEGWSTDYMALWPELLEKQVDSYASEGLDWRQIARERVFPFLNDRLPAMRAAHENLRGACEGVFSAAQKALGFEFDVVFVIYVGIGCGAGWGTRFQDSPSVLFGLENIVECGWSQPPSITGLVAHEIGHLVHDHWRARHDRAAETGPWWQLYQEGFAQRCEHIVLGADTWHMVSDVYGKDWLAWCQEHEGWLAAEFVRRVDQGESVRPFFGSWYDIGGRKQCGYFLGHELIRRFQVGMSLEEIALLDNADEWLRRELEKRAHNL
jgi:hypothetical protein